MVGLGVLSVLAFFFASPQLCVFQGSQTQEEKALAFLRNEKSWFNPSARRELTEFIADVKARRQKSAVPMLATHIAFVSPDHLFWSPNQDPKKYFPCYGALIEIGVDSIPSLVNRLAEIDSPGQEQTLLVDSLIQIYSRGGFGKELAKQRIQLEIENASGRDRDNLKSSLKSTIFD